MVSTSLHDNVEMELSYQVAEGGSLARNPKWHWGVATALSLRALIPWAVQSDYTTVVAPTMLPLGAT